MARMSLILGFCVLVAGGPLLAQQDEGSYEVFELEHVDAASLAMGLGGSTMMDQMQLLARQAAAAHGAMLIGALPGPLVHAVGGGMEPLLPDGLLGPPQAVLERNALIVRGTPEALDEFRELLGLLDQPTPLVRLELEVVTAFERFERDTRVQWRALPGLASVEVDGGGATLGDLRLSVGLGDMGVGLSQARRSTVADGYEQLSVTSQSGTPATIGLRTMQPTLIPQTARDPFGGVYTGYQLILTDIATALFVLPRVNRDGTVTMHLAPILQRQVGAVPIPGGGALPVVETLEETTVVTVRDGQTMAIGGLETVWDTRAVVLSPVIPLDEALGLRRTVEQTSVTLFITPRILPPPSADDIDPFL